MNGDVIELLKERQKLVQEEKQDAIEEGDEAQELYSVGKEDGLGYAIELLEQSSEDDPPAMETEGSDR